MSLKCRIYKDENGNIDFVDAANGNRSKLFDTLVNITGGNKNTALNLYAITEVEDFKDIAKAKVNSIKNRVKTLVKAAPEVVSEVGNVRFSRVASNSTYFSNAVSAINNLTDKNPKNTQGWVKQLTDTQKNGGVKNVNQELEWIGLEDYLNSYVKENNPKAGNIPASVVEDYIKANQIEIVDVSKEDYLKPVPLTFNKLNEFDEDDYGSTISSYETIEEVYEDDEVGYQIVETDEGYYVRDERTDNVYRDNNYENNLFLTFEEAVRVAGLHLADKNKISTEGTKYSGYQLKGAFNYREVLLTMPVKRTDITEAQRVLEEASLGNLDYNSIEVKEAQKTIEESNIENQKLYKSSHWDEANILAHVRMNEKTLPDGRKVLILNEIQADISQDLKKEQDKILDRVDKEFDNFLDNLIRNNVIIEEC